MVPPVNRASVPERSFRGIVVMVILMCLLFMSPSGSVRAQNGNGGRAVDTASSASALPPFGGNGMAGEIEALIQKDIGLDSISTGNASAQEFRYITLGADSLGSNRLMTLSSGTIIGGLGGLFIGMLYDARNRFVYPDFFTEPAVPSGLVWIGGIVCGAMLGMLLNVIL